MSKESYARGFVKAAAAAGVDPVQLAKYAQQYKTDGWAPPIVADLGTSAAPIYGYDDDPPPGVKDKPHTIALYERAEPIRSLRDVETALRVLGEKGAHEGDLAEFTSIPRAAIDPRYANWLNSHTKAISDIHSKIKPALDAANRGHYKGIDTATNTSLAESIARAYHDSMAASTGSVSRVSAPVKK